MLKRKIFIMRHSSFDIRKADQHEFDICTFSLSKILEFSIEDLDIFLMGDPRLVAVTVVSKKVPFPSVFIRH